MKFLEHWFSKYGPRTSSSTITWNWSISVVPKLQRTSQFLRELIQRWLLGPTPRVSDSAALGWSLRICISNKFPGDADAAGTTPENHWSRVPSPELPRSTVAMTLGAQSGEDIYQSGRLWPALPDPQYWGRS